MINDSFWENSNFDKEILNSLPFGLVISNSKGKIVFCNNYLLNLMGYERNEVEGTHTSRYYKNKGNYLDTLRKLNKNSKITDWYTELRKKDGSISENLINISYITLNDSSFVVSTLHDFTKHTSSEGERKFREFVDLLPQPVFEVDSRGFLTFINNYGLLSFGYSKEELENNFNVLRLFKVVDRERIIHLLGTTVEFNNDKISHDFELVRKDGTIVPVMIYSKPILEGNNQIGRRGVILEVTELRESEERYRRLIEVSPDGLVLTFLDGTIIIANQQAANILEFKTSDELIGQNLVDFFSEDDKIGIIEDINEILHLGSKLRMEHIMIGNKNRKFPVDLSSSILNDEKGKPSALITVIRDITERKIAAGQLTKQKEEIELYLNIITHDLKNYYMIAKEYLNMVLDEPLDNKEVINSLFQVRSSIVRSISVTDNISVMLKQSLSTEAPLTNIDLIQAINRVENLLIEQFPHKEIRIFKDDIPSKTLILADSLFTQLLLNLMNNSVKNDVNEVVKIDIRMDKPKDKKCSLYISDHGCGIKPNLRESLFERFSVYKKTGKGSGLGLFIVKTLIERYGGDIKIEDREKGEYQKGTTFVLTLNCP